MKIEEIIAKFKEEGKSEEEIKLILEEVKKDIEAYLHSDEGEAKDEEVHEEVHEDEVDEEKKMHEVFGI